MNTKWTLEQQEVIGLRGCNMLVAAAAGSGKTAVLVERIISRIMDHKKPVDVDRLLVVTFTNAAAGEMRERILQALEQRLEEEPDNAHLQRQVSLVHHAKITTIHSFCLDVIRNQFHRIGIEPGFRVGDENELRLLRQDVLEDLLEKKYLEGDADFLHFSESFATGKADLELEELVMKLYLFSMGQPDPEAWRKECCACYELRSEEELMESDWMRVLLKKVRVRTEDMTGQARQALALCRTAGGPWMYEPALEADLVILERLSDCSTYREYYEVLSAPVQWQALSRKKDPQTDERKKEIVNTVRKQIKNEYKKLQDDYFYHEPSQLLQDIRANAGIVRTLVGLTGEFEKAYASAKAGKNLVDFNDLEHFALRILVSFQDGSWVSSDIALEYARQFEEVMIDEYQDSNYVQEILLGSVSGKGQGIPNRFMVGDVKQSIYRFRLARPELFMDKYDTYQKDSGEDRRIDLHMNFRSRSQVLNLVNLIFYQIMAGDPGGIRYDQDAALYAGAHFEEGSSGRWLEPELYLLERTEEQGSTQQRRAEAVKAAELIRCTVGKELIWDKQEGKYRPARYSDIVILLRTVSGWSDLFAQILEDQGIPVYTGGSTGYFSAWEVRIILSLLQILDNPCQDIPLCAVLSSPIGGMTEEELAGLKIRGEKGESFYRCCMSCKENTEGEAEGETERKLRRFLEKLDRLRNMAAYTPMHLLLWEIYRTTGFYDYVTAMPAGAQRRANLDMLAEKATAYEATSYRGLFHFIRYIENLRKYEIDYGEAGLCDETGDTVRIMSIHKSKGLEFPVVILAGLGKVFNRMDVSTHLVLHPDLGIGCDLIDTENRLRLPLLVRSAISAQLKEETLGEELRILYVALTRAKEKLFLTGSIANMENSMKKWAAVCERTQTGLSYSTLMAAEHYLDWIVPALLRHPSGYPVLTEYGYDIPQECEVSRMSGSCRIFCESSEYQDMKQETDRTDEELKQELSAADMNTVYDQETKEYLKVVTEYQYAYRDSAQIPGKLSVSELKKTRFREEDEETKEFYEQTDVIPLIPEFRKEEQAGSGALRGTVYHSFMENLDFSADFDGNFLETQLETMVKCGKILKEEAELISRKQISRFLRSDLAARMQRADRSHMLRREQPFVIGIPADQIEAGWDPEETVLVQGIIDAYFYEGDDLILLDYKTDHVTGKDQLIARYQVQLDYYALTLERLTGKRVREKLIYSFWLNETIRL